MIKLLLTPFIWSRFMYRKKNEKRKESECVKAYKKAFKLQLTNYVITYNDFNGDEWYRTVVLEEDLPKE